MKRLRQSGFSLVELMIAILLAAITAIVVLNVLTSYQSRSNTTTGRNDAEISVAMGLYALEKDIRMGGAGLNTPTGPLCPMGANIAWDGDANTPPGLNNEPLLPVRIIDGDTGPDSIEIIRSDSDFGAAPTRLIAAMANQTAPLDVDSTVGLQNGDLILVGSSNGSKICTLMQLTAAPAANGSAWRLTHASGAGRHYNPAVPASTFSSPVSYDVRDSVVNMGTYGIRRFGIVCDGGGTPDAGRNCDLASWNSLDAGIGAAPNLDTVGVSSLSPQIVDLQAQYGVADPGSEVVNKWVDATNDGTDDWSAPSLANQNRIKAVRISIVARGAREGDMVAPASILLWQDDPDDITTAQVRALSDDERRFRYRSLTVVVPLINSIWSGT